MAKKQSELQILTANRLQDGEVVFLRFDLGWSESVDDAWIAIGDHEAALLVQEGEIWLKDNIVVDPYLVEVLDVDGQIKPIHYREQMRTTGPTVRRDLGKQARAIGGDAVFAPTEEVWIAS